MLPQDNPNLQQFIRHLTSDPNSVELVRQPLYDYILYPTAGSASPFSFFSVPQGQGLSSSANNAANPKGLADTNMQLAGALPQPQAFWIESIEVDFQPGSVATANTYTPQAPVVFNAAAAATLNAGVSDVNAVLSGGVLQLNVSNKAYYQEGPLLRFPTQKGFALDTAVAMTAAASAMFGGKMRSVGDPAMIDPGVALAAQQAFGVTIQYPTAIATPSGFNGRIGVILQGWLIRPVQ